MKTGKIKWFWPDMGLGFITPDEPGRDVLFSATVVYRMSTRPLQADEHVEYVAEWANDTLVATKVIRKS